MIVRALLHKYQPLVLPDPIQSDELPIPTHRILCDEQSIERWIGKDHTLRLARLLNNDALHITVLRTPIHIYLSKPVEIHTRIHLIKVAICAGSSVIACTLLRSHTYPSFTIGRALNCEIGVVYFACCRPRDQRPVLYCLNSKMDQFNWKRGLRTVRST